MSTKYVSIFEPEGRVTTGHVQELYRIYTRKHAREYGVFSGQPHAPILLHWNGKKNEIEDDGRWNVEVSYFLFYVRKQGNLCILMD